MKRKNKKVTLFASYSRAQALADGVLRDASELAKEAGFKIPVAITETVWLTCVEVPAACEWQDETGRLWDILFMLHHAILQKPNCREIVFRLYVQNSSRRPKLITLKGHCHPGDQGDPVITIMFPDED